MRLIDHSFADPASNLAYDEVLLNRAEAGESEETLRFWESPVHFVVLGVAQVLADEVNEAACRFDGIPILRRCSAGGCVLQGPGCLNFAFVLDHLARPEIQSIRGSYHYLLPRIASGFASRGAAVRCAGTSDLVIGDRKIAGNAQRRRKRYLLHHGSILYAADVALMGSYLKEPSERPDYRGVRAHGEFVQNVSLDPATIRSIVANAIDGGVEAAGPTACELEDVERLGSEKYRDAAFIRRR